MSSYHGRYSWDYVDNAIYQCQRDHAPIFWGHFIIPETLLGPSPTFQSSILARLPPELLCSIFEFLDPLGKICLAFTCKHLLRASSLANMEIPSAIKHRQFSLHSCIALRTLLHLILPFKSNGKPDKAVAVCSYCYRHRPTKKSYWKHIRGKFPERWRLSMIDSHIRSWEHRSSIQCPECLLEEELRQEEKYNKALNRYVRK